MVLLSKNKLHETLIGVTRMLSWGAPYPNTPTEEAKHTSRQRPLSLSISFFTPLLTRLPRRMLLSWEVIQLTAKNITQSFQTSQLATNEFILIWKLNISGCITIQLNIFVALYAAQKCQFYSIPWNIIWKILWNRNWIKTRGKWTFHRKCTSGLIVRLRCLERSSQHKSHSSEWL